MFIHSITLSKGGCHSDADLFASGQVVDTPSEAEPAYDCSTGRNSCMVTFTFPYGLTSRPRKQEPGWTPLSLEHSSKAFGKIRVKIPDRLKQKARSLFIYFASAATRIGGARRADPARQCLRDNQRHADSGSTELYALITRVVRRLTSRNRVLRSCLPVPTTMDASRLRASNCSLFGAQFDSSRCLYMASGANGRRILPRVRPSSSLVA